MSSEPTFEQAAANLRDAYIGLGSAIVGARMVEGPGFRGISSSMRHVVGNFAVAEGADRTTAFELWRVAREAPRFHAYLPCPNSDVDDRELLDRGFSSINELLIMGTGSVALGRTERPLSLIRLDSSELREVGAELISRVFFSHLPPATRDQLTRLNAVNPHVVALGAWEALASKTYRNIVGTLTLQMSQECCGIYNLCIEPWLRNQGFGKALVAKVANSEVVAGRPLVLQCSADLQAWYQSLGFRELGRVRIYAFGDSA